MDAEYLILATVLCVLPHIRCGMPNVKNPWRDGVFHAASQVVA